MAKLKKKLIPLQKPFSKMTDSEWDAVIAAQSPHQTRDGPWGGWGAAQWFNGERFGYPNGDVVERKLTGTDWFWSRLWVEKTASWRPISDEDRKRLPPPDNPRTPSEQ